MTTTTNAPTTNIAPAATGLLAALGIGAAVLLTAVGTFWDITGNETGEADSFTQYLPVVGMILVAAGIVFGLVVRTATASNGGLRALILGVLAVLTVVVAWTGFPAVLAAGSVACALRARRGALPAISLALSVLALVGAVAFAIAG